MIPSSYTLRRVRPERIGAAARAIALIAESDAFENGMMSNMRVEFLRMAIENLGRVCNRTEDEVEDTNQQSQENPHAS